MILTHPLMICLTAGITKVVLVSAQPLRAEVVTPPRKNAPKAAGQQKRQQLSPQIQPNGSDKKNIVKVTAPALNRLLENSQIIPAPVGDGNCEAQDLSEVDLKRAQRFQHWFVETYLGGKYIELKTNDENSLKYWSTLDLFDEFDTDFNGYLDTTEISNLATFSGIPLDFLNENYVSCLYQDNLLDEDELLKAVCVGEPHFTTWQGTNFDYHGACDLVLYSNAAFDGGRGIDLHIRTEQIEGGQYSYASNAALRLGQDILEVQKDGSILLNNKVIEDPSSAFPLRLGLKFRTKYDFSKKCFNIGTHITHKCIEATTVSVMLDTQEFVHMKVFANMVHVEVVGRPNVLGSSEARGLMGMYGPDRRHGRVARDGTTLVDKPNDYGQEWQVRPLEEPTLFKHTRYPQFPQLCIPPSDMHFSQTTRHLRQFASREEEEMLRQKAHEACQYLLDQGYSNHVHKNCIFDVMATGDESTALIYGSW